MIELHITVTSKSYAPSAQWQRYDDRRRTFPDKVAAHEWLRTEYGKSRRAPMYRDNSDGGVAKVGYVIGFRNSDYENKWLEQHWIEFRECVPVSPDLRKGVAP